MEPEYSVSCCTMNGRFTGMCFDLLDDAREYFDWCIERGAYASVELYDRVDNMLDQWMAEEEYA